MKRSYLDFNFDFYLRLKKLQSLLVQFNIHNKNKMKEKITTFKLKFIEFILIKNF